MVRLGCCEKFRLSTCPARLGHQPRAISGLGFCLFYSLSRRLGHDSALQASGDSISHPLAVFTDTPATF
jgi:hypothetical protein